MDCRQDQENTQKSQSRIFLSQEWKERCERIIIAMYRNDLTILGEAYEESFKGA